MKKPLIITQIFIMLCLCNSCKTLQYVPVETVKTELRSNNVRDSIFRYDSIFLKQQGDTIYLERYRYLYRDKIVRDSIFKIDSIRVPYPVEIIKEVKKPLTGWQNFQQWTGRIAIVIALLLILYFALKLKKKASNSF